MQIYLPIAEVSIDVFLLLGMGGAVGFLSGVFGVGGGFLMTPLLIFVGIPPAIAVASEANQVVASSMSGVIAHWRRGRVDFLMGGILLAGGIVGAAFGIWLFGILRELGQIDFVIRLTYVIFLGVIGILMVVESVRLTLRKPGASRSRLNPKTIFHRLPLKIRFRNSRLYISALLPVGLGFLVGILAAIMGVGGGFFMVPAMIYLLGMPTAMVAGTSLFQVIFVTAMVTFLQAYNHQTVDLILALLLMVGAVIGAQFGARAGLRLKSEELRALLGILVLMVGVTLLYTLVSSPASLFTVMEVRG